MQPVTRAVIDVGTNSVKLLVAEVNGREVNPVSEESHQTRLGRGFYPALQLQPDPIAKTARAVAEFAVEASRHQAVSIRVVATSAARDAVNGHELTGAIERASGLKVQIISGDQEADWAYQGVCTDPALAPESLLLLDVGGGSTEFIIGHCGRKDFRQSHPLGTVRLLEQLRPGDPPQGAELTACRNSIREFLAKHVQPSLQPVLQRAGALTAVAANRRHSQPTLDHKHLDSSLHTPAPAIQLVGTGGTATILGCMEARLDTFDRQRLEATRLSAQRLRWHVERLWGRSLEERRQIIGLPKNRADVILTGAAIYETVMDMFDFQELRVSTRGLRFAAVLADQ